MENKELRRVINCSTLNFYSILSDTVKSTQLNLVYHVQSALEDSVKDHGNFSGDMDAQLVHNGCHGAEDLRLPGSWNIPLVVYEHSFQQGRHKVLCHLNQRNSSNYDGCFTPSY